MLLPVALRARKFKLRAGLIEMNMSEDIPSDSLSVLVIAGRLFPDYQKTDPVTQEREGNGLLYR